MPSREPPSFEEKSFEEKVEIQKNNFKKEVDRIESYYGKGSQIHLLKEINYNLLKILKFNMFVGPGPIDLGKNLDTTHGRMSATDASEIVFDRTDSDFGLGFGDADDDGEEDV